jgi:hypothetical protein
VAFHCNYAGTQKKARGHNHIPPMQAHWPEQRIKPGPYWRKERDNLLLVWRIWRDCVTLEGRKHCEHATYGHLDDKNGMEPVLKLPDLSQESSPFVVESVSGRPGERWAVQRSVVTPLLGKKAASPTKYDILTD